MAKFLYKNTRQVIESTDKKKIEAMKKNKKFKEIGVSKASVTIETPTPNEPVK